MQEQEQSANTVRQAIVRTDQWVQEHESEQRAAARVGAPVDNVADIAEVAAVEIIAAAVETITDVQI